MISDELFDGYVKDALARLYDPGALQKHPLVALLGADRPGAVTSGQVLRQTLLEAIEALRPAERIPYGRPEWLAYRILWLRYVECQEPAQICHELGLGRTSFYHYHRQALEAIASILRTRCQSPTSALPQPSPELARAEAMRAAGTAPRQIVSLDDVLAAVQETMRPLAEQRAVEWRVQAPPALPITYGDPALVRQVLLNVLTEAVGLARERTLTLQVCVEGAETVWQVRGLSPAETPREMEHRTGFVVSQGLLKVYGGRLWVAADETGAPSILFTMPVVRPKTILIVDDNADALALYRRYLQAEGYLLRAAESADEVRALLAEAPPDLVLLDVLMPRQDGWDILQRLKTLPETAHVPVVICSVLHQPDLALLLGATAVLQKPVDQQALVETVRRLLDNS